MSLTPLASGAITRNALISSSVNAFLYPNKGGPASPRYTYGADLRTGTDSGEILDGNCNDKNQPRTCNVRITGLNQSNFLMDLRSIYAKSRVTISATGYDGNQIRIRNAQTLVDSTGKAQDVLRRIQVRIPSHNSYNHSDFGVEAMGDICKQLSLTPTASPALSTEQCTP
jgi:hypothetical protein